MMIHLWRRGKCGGRNRLQTLESRGRPRPKNGGNDDDDVNDDVNDDVTDDVNDDVNGDVNDDYVKSVDEEDKDTTADDGDDDDDGADDDCSNDDNSVDDEDKDTLRLFSADNGNNDYEEDDGIAGEAVV